MAAPKGNKFAKGNEGGRQPQFQSNEILQQKVEQYFIYIKGEKKTTGKGKDAITEWVRYPENATISGLALFLGFESRQSFYDYEKNEEFSYTIKKARLRIESAYEQELLSRNATGAIFALKNFGWRDKQELEHTGAMDISWHEERTYEAK